MKTIKWSGKPRFNKGIRIAIKCAIGLQKMMATKFNVPSLLTANHTQDFLESFFSVIRGMMAANNNPTAVMFLQRCKYYITQKILEDDDFDIFSLKETLEMYRDLSDMDDDFSPSKEEPAIDEGLPELVSVEECQDEITDDSLSDDDENVDKDEEVLDDFVAARMDKLQEKHDPADNSYQIGIEWIAASMASKFEKVDNSLGTTEIKMTVPKDFLNAASTKYTNSLCKGGMLRPTEKWLSDVKKMDEMFLKHHPENGLRKGCGVTEDFTKLLESHFPERDVKILTFFTRLRTRIRIRKMNAKVMAPKRGTYRGTLRNSRKQAETAYRL